MENISNSVLFVSLTVEQAKELFKNWIDEALSKNEPATDPEPAFYTRHDIRRIFHLSLPTVDKYAKLGLIKGSKVGTRILFAKTDIEEALKSIPALKYKRL